MDYRETLQWMFSQLPMYQRVGKAAYKANHDNTIKLLESLSNPQDHFKAIHIAGTNGKGSVSHLISSILQEAGYKTGLYTSPHLVDFRERIKINGQMITEDAVMKFISNNKDVFSNIGASFFEMTVGMAFDFFKNENVDFAVIETGLGGRLDSTNLCNPEISIITNVSMDHMALLGDTIDKIALEKAGIIKDSIPVVIGRHNNITDPIFTKIANDHNSEIIFAEDYSDLKPIHKENSQNLEFLDIWYDNKLVLSDQENPLHGEYQSENIITTISSIMWLIQNRSINISFGEISERIEKRYKKHWFCRQMAAIRKKPL